MIFMPPRRSLTPHVSSRPRKQRVALSITYRVTFLFSSVSCIFGILIGAWFFSSIQPRSLLAVRTCDKGTCLRINEITGLLASVGIQHAVDFLPSIIEETDRSIAFISPMPKAPVHFIIVPKKDLKSIEDVTAEDTAYLIDAFAIMTMLVHDYGLSKYQILTNGPGYQKVGYLHFHLMGEK